MSEQQSHPLSATWLNRGITRIIGFLMRLNQWLLSPRAIEYLATQTALSPFLESVTDPRLGWELTFGDYLAWDLRTRTNWVSGFFTAFLVYSELSSNLREPVSLAELLKHIEDRYTQEGFGDLSLGQVTFLALHDFTQ